MVVGLLGALLGGGLLARCLADARVQEIEVLGNGRAGNVEVRHLADIREGERLLAVDLSGVIEGVLRHPWVVRAKVRRVFPSTLRIEVEEHRAAMLLAHDGLYRVSRTGEIFVRARSSDLDQPILTGVRADLIDRHGALARRIIQDALNVLEAVEHTGPVFASDVSEIHFDEDLGFTLRLRNRAQIHMGFRDPNVQLERLGLMVDAGLDLQIPQEIDMDIDGIAVATPISS